MDPFEIWVAIRVARITHFSLQCRVLNTKKGERTFGTQYELGSKTRR
ncbi:MAG: hypothetical protein ACE5EQ_03515 [Phycisphaerae bacterium]